MLSSTQSASSKTALLHPSINALISPAENPAHGCCTENSPHNCTEILKTLLTVAQKILLTIAQTSCPQLHWIFSTERENQSGKFKQAAVMGRRRGRTPPVERHQGHIPDPTHFLLVL
jgi:hypothetical protein